MSDKKSGIRSQVAWLTVVPLLVMVIGLESFFLHERFFELDHSLRTRGQLLASQLAVGSEFGIFSGNRVALQLISSRTLQQPDVSAVVVLNAAGEIQATAGSVDSETQLAMENANDWLTRVNLHKPIFDNGKVWLLYQPIWSEQLKLEENEAKAAPQQLGAVVLAMNWESTRRLKSELLWFSLFVTGIFLLITLNLVYLASRRITEPIRQLSQMIKALSEGQLDTRVQVSTHVTELAEVAHGMNVMAAQLQKENAQLHQRVAEETRLSAVAFESHESMIITDVSGVILRVNRAFTEITGYTAAEAIGQTPRLLKSGMHGEGFYAGMWDKLLHHGKWQGELWDKRKNGEIFPSWVSITAITDSDGEVLHYLAAYVDITSRKRVEKQLADMLAFSEAVLEQASYGIAVYQAEGPCVMANQAYATTLGATSEAVMQQNFRTISSWTNNGLLECAYQVLASREMQRCQVEGETSFGKQVFLECILSYLTISDKSHILLIINDISSRVLAERALLESNQQLERKELAKTRFLAAAGHDLRQPLTAASMFIYALKSTMLDKSQDGIVRQLDHAMLTFGGLLDALLNVSKLDAGRIKPIYTAIKVFDILSGLEQDFSPIVREKQLGFKLYFPMKTQLELSSDFGLIKSVLMNLLANAIKFTPQGGVMVSVRRRGNTALFQVWDTGIGIQDEALDYIFDEFYQVNNPQRDRTSGLGLGLAIVRRTLELLGSEISCRSRPGRGTVFSFALPLADFASKAPPLPVQSGVIEATTRVAVTGKKFIVVEDDLLVAQATQSCLEGMGAGVRVFHQAEIALQQALAEPADYYLVDYMLGGTMDGIEFLNQLGKQSADPVNAVLMTGDTSSRFIHRSANFAWPVLYKPVHVPELLAKLGVRSGV